MPGGDVRPNIILLLTDQRRFDSLSCTGVGGVPHAEIAALMPDARYLAAGGAHESVVAAYRNSGIGDRGRSWEQHDLSGDRGRRGGGATPRFDQLVVNRIG